MVTQVVANDVAIISELVIPTYAQAIAGGDLAGWLALWLPEGKQMPPGAPARVGLEQIGEGNRPLFELFDTEMGIHPEEIRVLGDHAYMHGEYDYAMTPKEGGQAIRGSGKFLTILRKQADGSWKLAIDCFNDNAAGSAP